jgi:hypothetical protein
MRRRRTAGAMVMCATFLLIAAAPLVQSSEETVHTVLKFENGPPSTCAIDWDFEATSDGVWSAHILNYGMRWLIIDMVNMDTGGLVIDREMYRFAAVGNDYTTPGVALTGGHMYNIKATPNGPMDSYCTVEDIFEPIVVPEDPVADFSVTVDGLTVTVDASDSLDPDGGEIVSYDWDWGDGTSGMGMVTTHTYEVPPGVAPPASDGLGDIPVPPFSIYGYTRDGEGVLLPYCTVTLTNVNTSEAVVMDSGAEAFYMKDLRELELGYLNGNVILVEAVNGDLAGENQAVLDFMNPIPYIQLDIVLESGAPPEPFDVTITLTVTDDEGATATLSKTVTVYPS